MKKLLTLLVTGLLTVSAIFGLTACGKETKNSVIDPKTKTITVGYTDYEPMNYTEDDVLKGFDTELAIMTFNALGYNVKFKLIDWDNKYLDLNSGSIDCIWNGFTSNGDDDGVPRSSSVDFTYDYMKNAQCIVRKNSTAELTDYSGLQGKSVGFEEGSAGQTLIDDNTASVNVLKKGQVDQMAAISALEQGSVDYAVVDILLAQAITGKGDYADLVINEGIDIEGEFYAVGFKIGSPLTEKVNTMFEAFAKTGVLLELATKYELQNSVVTNFD